MASQDMAILLFGTLQNSRQVHGLDFAPFFQFKIADWSFAAGGGPADRRSAYVSATPSAGTLTRSPIGANPERHMGVHHRNVVYSERAKAQCLAVADLGTKFQEIGPLQRTGRQAIIYFVGVATSLTWARRSADTRQGTVKCE